MQNFIKNYAQKHIRISSGVEGIARSGRHNKQCNAKCFDIYVRSITEILAN